MRLESGENVIALVSMYEGKQIIRNKTLSEIAAMAIRASGKRGSGVQYVEEIAGHLRNTGIEDPIVTDLLQEIQGQLLWQGRHMPIAER